MKKIYLFIFGAAIFTTAAFLPEADAQKGLNFGIKIIPQSTWIFNDSLTAEGPSVDYIPTFHSAFGITVGYKFTDGVGIQSEIIYSLQGQKFQDNSAGSDYLETWKTNYIKVPLLLTFNSSSESTTMFSGFIGPQLGFLTSAKQSYSFGGTKWYDYDEDYAKPNNEPVFKKYWMSSYTAIVFGFGASFKLSKMMQLSTRLRFDYGLTDACTADITMPHLFVIYVKEASYNHATGGLEIGFTYFLK